MNILLMTDKLTTGGAEHYFCKLENELNHPELVFYTAASGGELYKNIYHKNRFMPMSRRNHAANLSMIKRKVMEHDIDVIHANSLRMVLYAAWVQKLIRKQLKIIYTKHNVTMMEKKLRPAFVRLLNSSVMKVITVSGYEEKNLIRLGVHPDKVTTIYNGVDLKQFAYRQKESEGVCKVGILARLSPEKNHELFLEIAKQLKAESGLRFYIGGDGPQYQKIRQQIEALQLTHCVEMIGAVAAPERFIQEMDILLLTSHREVFPMVILEAMAVGTPVISIDTGGIKEAIISDEVGCLIPDYSAERFCRQILAWKENERWRHKVADCAYDRVTKSFSLEKMVHLTMNEYLDTH
ncbi:glycosyltransferase family 4 protein [Bacillus badius]|uniref:Teichuronic acid biosynthesis glycosyl transferase TuaC n=1 Tax=Bacillus badius TaxID=1455 RepID=A0ABR5AR51_BACBA|nr:glycosyltransferase family 4 protein [Bacillus badius]KIL77230.1 putative teichuronic acid biosynthesis glycosyl transferase TuaC [Bacillus badius]KZO01075.1 glycosyltransferase [Bacillus badius]MED0667985.1 glycosyltransferase family 4 protein [Bacillus badius]MED4717593.1 glycosyltransferase family 4 protein [Bacillus badius]OCS89127.1 glycosyltransferase [Bacillus badius]